MRNGYKPFPLILNRIVVLQIQICFGVFNAVFPKHSFQRGGDRDADSAVGPGRVDADQTEIDDLGMLDSPQDADDRGGS